MKVSQEEPRDPETYAIIGAAMDVHRELRPGFLEAVYQEALEIELRLRSIPYEREVRLPVFYKRVLLNTGYRADFRCFGTIMVELKAASQLTGTDEAQLLNYLRSTRLNRGLLFNFGRSSLEFRRLISDPNYRSPTSTNDDSTSNQLHPD